jgi:hypothetical protein
VVAAQPRAGLGLAQEPRDDAGVGGHRLVQHLDRDPLLELEVRGDRDHAHTALAEDPLDAEVVADDRADLWHAPFHCSALSTPCGAPCGDVA